MSSRWTLAAFSLAVLSYCPSALAEPTPESSAGVPAFLSEVVAVRQGAALSQKSQGDAKVSLLSLSGSGALRGRQAGALVGQRVLRMTEVMRSDLLFRSLSLIKKADQRRLQRHFSPEFRAEAEALAREVGLRQEQVLFINAIPDIFKTFACSAVVADERSRGGEYLFGRNLDYMNFGGETHELSMITVVTPEKGARYASIGFAGLLGVLSAMNEHGLTISVLEISGTTQSDAMPYMERYRQVIERCTTVEEAIALVKGQRISTANVLLVADAAGAMAAIEQTPTRVEVRRPKAFAGRLAQTNHFHLPAMQRLEHPLLWPLNHKSLMRVLGSPRTSGLRYTTLYNRISKAETITGDDVKALMRATDLGPMTLQSMIFRPAEQSLEVAFGAPPATTRAWVRFSREELFGPTPVVARADD